MRISRWADGVYIAKNRDLFDSLDESMGIASGIPYVHDVNYIVFFIIMIYESKTSIHHATSSVKDASFR